MIQIEYLARNARGTQETWDKNILLRVRELVRLTRTRSARVRNFFLCDRPSGLQFQMDVLSVFRVVSPACATFTDAYFPFFQMKWTKLLNFY